MLKNSMATLYIDGQLINTVKVRLRASKTKDGINDIIIVVVILFIIIPN